MTQPLASTRSPSRFDKRLSDSVRCMLDYIAKSGPCHFTELHSQFSDDCTSGRARENLRARLAYLSRMGHLQTSGHGPTRRWQIDFRPRTAGVPRPKPAPAPMPMAQKPAPSPSYDRMHAPAYVPEAGPVLRPGSLDYKACASRGFAC